MSSDKALISLFGNGHRENDVFTRAAGESVVCHFDTSGNDSLTDRYLFIRQFAKKVHISVNKAASITHIGGKELKAPKTIPTGGIVFKGGIEWKSITVKSDQAATTFEIYAS